MQLQSDIPGLTFKPCQYGQHSLQQVGVWQWDPPKHQEQSGLWIVFIHGGAWRDPEVNMYGFEPSIRHILADDRIPQSAIQGFASINYRLSQYEAFPQDPETPESELQRAKHPDHIEDVHSALGLLADEYHVRDNYVLIGHSGGATLSFQLVMGEASHAGRRTREVALPLAIISISGLYDLAAGVQRNPPYESFVTGAFSSDRKVWHTVSPIYFSGSYKQNLSKVKVVLLAWSTEDHLVDELQIDNMASKLKADEVSGLVLRKDLFGLHDFVWQDGSQISRLLSETLGLLNIT